MIATRATSLRQALANVAAERGGRPALVHRETVCDDEARTITHAALDELVGRTSMALIEHGVGPSDSVAIVGASLPEYLLAFYAASDVAIAFPMNPLLASAPMAQQLAMAGTRICIIVGNAWETDLGTRLATAFKSVPSLRTVVVAGAEPPAGMTAQSLAVIGWDAFLASASGRSARPQQRPGDAIATYFHTGGTSGSPKLARLSRRALLGGPAYAAECLGWSPDDRVLNLLPYFHVGGALSIATSALLSGAANLTCGWRGARDPALIAAFWMIAGQMSATAAGLVPTSWGSIADAASGPVPPCFRAMLSGGASMPRPVRQRLIDRVGVPFCELYGMTEFAGFCSSQSLDGRFAEPGVGVTVGAMDIVLRDPPGEVSLRGPNAFSGYLTTDGVTKDPAGGFVETGDIGRFDGDGQLVLSGRSKDVIVRGGHNIDPATIEQTALGHPAVRQAAAVGRPDLYAGEVPVLYLVVEDGASIADIEAHIGSNIIEPPARPKAISVIDAMPTTLVGKLDRNGLRQRATIEMAAALLAHHAPRAIRCTDAAARELLLDWEIAPSREQLDAIEMGLGEVGLSWKPLAVEA